MIEPANSPVPSPPPAVLDLTIYVPCYNEERLITSTLDHIREALAGFDMTYEVLVYDDGSKDRTRQVTRDYLQQHGLDGQFSLIERDTNCGIGVNYYDAADRARGRYFLVASGDDSEPVETLRRVLNLTGKADAIVPYLDTRLFDLRFNGDCRGIHRRFISILFAWIVRTVSGHNLRYFNGCVLHRTENVRAHRLPVYGLGYQAELLCRVLSQPGTSFLEVRIFNNDRRYGMPTAFKPKNIISVLGSLWRIFRERLAWRSPPKTAS
jgi:glycosyltransferase involved in cell wall biosynthesis